MSYALAGPLYTAAKDMVIYVNNKVEYVKRLEQNLMLLTMEIATLNSRRLEADRKLEMSAATMDTSGEYEVLILQINMMRKGLEDFLNIYIKSKGHLFIPELAHEKATNNILSRITLPNLNDSIIKSIVDSLMEIEPNVWTLELHKRGNLSEDVERLYFLAKGLVDRLKPENLLLEAPPKRVILQHADFKLPQFDKLYVDKIMEHLEEDVKRIAILGPIGVGKSTIMKMLNNRFTKSTSKLCPDYVIWISFPTKHEGDATETIQDEILTRLKIKAACRNTFEKRETISSFLSEKNYILLIDQVSSQVDLDRLGIHQNHKDGKVVVASSNKWAIQQMRIGCKVEIRRLLENEAMVFFETICKIRDSLLRETAQKIIRLCDGLPLVIYLVALHLSDSKTHEVWRNLRRTLKKDPKPSLVNDLVKYCEAHEMVYNELENENRKKCSVYGALFPAELRIDEDYLIECWMAESLLDDNHNTRKKMTKARDRGGAVVQDLTARYLLERCSDSKGHYVKIPFYFRKFALQREEIQTRNNTMSQIHQHLKSLECTNSDPHSSENRECIELEALFLQHSEGLSEVKLCKCMGKLRILDLQGTKIGSVPDLGSLSSLVNLYLNECSDLETIPHEEKHYPKKLELLDIRGTSIHPWLPEVVGNIKSLRCLRVSFDKERCNDGFSQIIKKLEQLEELIIETDFSQRWKNVADPIVNAIAEFKNLTTLHFNFPMVNILQKFTRTSSSWEKLKSRSFKFSVGSKKNGRRDIRGTLATWKPQVSSDGEISSITYHEEREETRALTLMGDSDSPGLKNLGGYNFQFQEWEAVKVCCIQESTCLESVIDSSEPCMLQNLVRLHLSDLESLKCMWKGSAVPDGSLSNLTILTICRCPKLKEVLNPTLSKPLPSLKYLKVEYCAEMVMVIATKKPDEGPSDPEINSNVSDIVPKLERIELIDLPKLKSICDDTAINGSLLMKTKIERCPQLTNPENATEPASISVPDSLVQESRETSGPLRNENQPSEVNHGTGIPEENGLTNPLRVSNDVQRHKNENPNPNVPRIRNRAGWRDRLSRYFCIGGREAATTSKWYDQFPS